MGTFNDYLSETHYIATRCHCLAKVSALSNEYPLNVAWMKRYPMEIRGTSRILVRPSRIFFSCTHWSDRCLCTVDTVSRTFDRRGSVASREAGPTLPDRTTSHLFALKERNKCKTLNHSVYVMSWHSTGKQS